jgi:hypothetical protein
MMTRLTALVVAIATAGATNAAYATNVPNLLDVVVVDGPLAGHYQAPGSEVICLHAKKQQRYSAAWRDFNAQDPKKMSEAGINVSNPDDAGAKHGEVRIAFGDPDKKPTIYSADQVALTLKITGKIGEIAFQGKSKEGVRLRVTARCLDVEEM